MENAPATADDNLEMTEQAASTDTAVLDDAETNLHPVVVGFNKLSIVRQIALIGGLALVVALMVGIFTWSKEPNFKPLIHRMQDFNAQSIFEVLQREGIEFELDPATQVLMVRADELHDARMKLASASLIDDKTVGLEVLDQESSLGTSHFVETARFRRGLEGELARTISSVQTVRNARVHLAIPKQSVFVRDHRKPRASVFLELYAGRDLDKEQVDAIINLVAQSVSEMEKSDVSIVDQYGNLLSRDDTKSDDHIATKQLEYTEKVEDSITQRVNNILKPVLGKDNYKAEVSADVDFTLVEQSEELFNPDLIAIRSEQLIDEQKVAGNDGGIPGALSNQPPGEVTAPEQVDPATGKPMGNMDRRSEKTRNYEVDRTLSYKQQQVGKVKRITVAVVVNDKEVMNAESGDMEYQSWNENDLARLEVLVKDAVGFDASRGDSINVINSPFMGKGEVEFESPEFWTQPWFWEIVKQLLAGIFILILIFGVIRPTVKSVMDKGREGENDEDLDAIEDDGLDEDQISLAGAEEYLLPGASESFERQLDALKGLIAEDPARVAQLMIKWVSEEDA